MIRQQLESVRHFDKTDLCLFVLYLYLITNDFDFNILFN